MDKSILTIVSMRAAALALALAGQSKASVALYQLADLVQAGVAVDAHMEAVAQILRERDLTKQDWDDVEAKIAADYQTIMAEDPSTHSVG